MLIEISLQQQETRYEEGHGWPGYRSKCHCNVGILHRFQSEIRVILGLFLQPALTTALDNPTYAKMEDASFLVMPPPKRPVNCLFHRSPAEILRNYSVR